MTAPSDPPCVYGQWREPHPARDPVETTRVRAHNEPDNPTYACRTCIPTPDLPGA